MLSLSLLLCSNYLLGCSNEVEKKFEEAKNCFKGAVNVLRAREEMICENAEGKESVRGKSELQEIEVLLLELESRMQDVDDWETEELKKAAEKEQADKAVLNAKKS
eukprot:Pgem_evm1s16327